MEADRQRPRTALLHGETAGQKENRERKQETPADTELQTQGTWKTGAGRRGSWCLDRNRGSELSAGKKQTKGEDRALQLEEKQTKRCSKGNTQSHNSRKQG